MLNQNWAWATWHDLVSNKNKNKIYQLKKTHKELLVIKQKSKRKGKTEVATRSHTDVRARPKLVDWCFIWISILWSKASIRSSSNPFLKTPKLTSEMLWRKRSRKHTVAAVILKQSNKWHIRLYREGRSKGWEGHKDGGQQEQIIRTHTHTWKCHTIHYFAR